MKRSLPGTKVRPPNFCWRDCSLFASDPTAPARAKQLLFELLEQAQASPESAEISVTLAAIETLGRWQLKQWRRASLTKFGDLVADYIVASAERGFDLASVAFAAIGRELRYNDPELFVKVFDGAFHRGPRKRRRTTKS